MQVWIGLGLVAEIPLVRLTWLAIGLGRRSPPWTRGLGSWPGEGRQEPEAEYPDLGGAWARSQSWLRSQASEVHEQRSAYRLLDVGCGVKLYYPVVRALRERVRRRGSPRNPAADLEGRSNALPVDDASFDVVICTQVLEHCDDPAQAVRELRRVSPPAAASSCRRTA